VASFGSTQGPSWSGRGAHGCTPKLFGPPEENLTKTYKFMFQKALDIREALSWRIEELGDLVLFFFFSPPLPLQEPVTVLGQIGCDSNGKLNAKSVVLEGDREHSSGGQIPLDLSELQEYSLFPGQVIVALEGTNNTGRRMVVSKLYELILVPYFPVFSPIFPSAGSQLILVPYFPVFSPIFPSAGSQLILVPYFPVFSPIFPSAGSQLVLVPSLRDVHHDFVYPQPPFVCPDLPKDDKPRVHLVSDPCTLDIDGVVLGLTSTDLLFHMGAEEISSSSGISDRFTRILKHILTQRSYASLPVTPDVLVTPSELRYFVKDVLGCVCINPGRLTKGRVGGTYGRLYLQREATAGQRRSPCVAAQVVKI
uniref:DNA polymerase alpha subunit B n=1 Tax=Strix occidentalis caurina TaxID=311401 RepID=A0A8D0KSR6_STROC